MAGKYEGFVYDYPADDRKRQQNDTATSDSGDRYEMHSANVTSEPGNVVDVVELGEQYFERGVHGWTLLDNRARVRRQEVIFEYLLTPERLVFHEGWHNAHRPEFEIDPTDHEASTHARERSRPPVRFNYTGSASWRNANYGSHAGAY
ncbi:MAG: hypothetical protein HYW25_05405 [Candidatus Aenigmarchaeota archaeon]|nr:hypothetical protein [Candidatus Aenigmarchaeota archaeon]